MPIIMFKLQSDQIWYLLLILLNVKLGSDNTGRELVMGKEGLGVMNENWELFAGFCAQNDLVIGSAVFPHKRIHKLTWTSPDQTTRNQIDHMTISRQWRRTMEDVRVYRGADAGSDHKLVITSLKVRLAKAPVTVQQRTKRFDSRPEPWVLHCPAKQIPNINRPGRALYRYQVGTDQNIIPCNMWREPIIGVAITSVHQFHWLQESLRHGRQKHHVEDRIMRHYGIPLKIVSIIHSLYDGMTCQVIHNHIIPFYCHYWS